MNIPDPPRVARWRAALAWQWPLGLGAGLVFVIFSVMMAVFWLSDFRDLPFDDMALDSEAKTFQAQVLQVDPKPHGTPTKPLYAVRYTFDLGDGRPRFGVSYTEDRLRFSQGSFYDLDYLAGDPNVNRLTGTTRSISSLWMPWFLGSFWLPSLVLLAWWLRGVFRLRYVLNNGQGAVAEILGTRTLGFINPSQLSVRYRYQDRYAEYRNGRHWVRLSSGRGKLLSKGAETMDVVYDEMRGLSRLVMPEDFVRVVTGAAAP